MPSYNETLHDQNVTEGGNVTLTCIAAGMPPPVVSWIKSDGRSIAENVLERMNISRIEAGEYKCEACNECGNATKTASIYVQCKKLPVLRCKLIL